MIDPEPCPCSSGREFASCCRPFLLGAKRPATAEALMRSRYTAYARGDLAYIRSTLHPRARDGFDEKATREWSTKSAWRGLEVVATEGGSPGDRTGTVEFIARYTLDGTAQEHHEVAEFRKDDGIWFFLDGKVRGGEPFVREAPKVGRNDPCPCGSGKKHKKCCGR